MDFKITVDGSSCYHCYEAPFRVVWKNTERLDEHFIRVESVEYSCCQHVLAINSNPCKCGNLDANICYDPGLARLLETGHARHPEDDREVLWICEACAFWKLNWRNEGDP